MGSARGDVAAPCDAVEFASSLLDAHTRVRDDGALIGTAIGGGGGTLMQGEGASRAGAYFFLLLLPETAFFFLPPSMLTPLSRPTQSDTTPAPTVIWPSRIANLRPFSTGIG